MDVDNIPMTPVKRRRSFFIPPNDSVLHENNPENNSTEIKYIKKIKKEEKQWKKIYEEKKEHQKDLLNKLKTSNTQMIDYNKLDPEDIEFLNASFDIESFLKKAKKLQDMLKVAHLQTEHIFKRKSMLMEQIDELTVIFETEFCNKI